MSEQFFGELAAQYSVELALKATMGCASPQKACGQPVLEKAAFELAPGELSGIVEVNGRYVVLKSRGFTSPVVLNGRYRSKGTVSESSREKATSGYGSIPSHNP